ncbi:MAG TPA: copper resistance CopC family protein [Ktedonobacterales bacterium]|nr:copper resistance CopC family protein [Ktedonobacterales bacterium]
MHWRARNNQPGSITLARGSATASTRIAWRMGWAGALALVALLSGALLLPGLAAAHAYYVSSDPAAGAVLKAAPTLVTVHFAESVNPHGSDIIVYDANHKPVSTAQAQVAHADIKTMTVPMAGDGDGIYFVEWHTVSGDDGDPDIGGFNFTVNSKATGDTTPTPTTNSGGGSGGSTGIPVWLTVLVGLAGLAIGGVGTFYATRRRA